jgi:hypothetical protein
LVLRAKPRSEAMTTIEVNDLAFRYASDKTKFNTVPDLNYYANAVSWFKTRGGTKDDYFVFIELVHMFVNNDFSLRLGEAYSGFPEWE